MYYRPLAVCEIRLDDPRESREASKAKAEGHRLKRIDGGCFGPTRMGRVHQGVDLYAEVGTPIYAVCAGKVKYIPGAEKGLGNRVHLECDVNSLGRDMAGYIVRRFGCGNSIWFVYAHLSDGLPSLSEVRAGQMIGRTGVTGNGHSFYPHLHFEVRTSEFPGYGLIGRIDPLLLFRFPYRNGTGVMDYLSIRSRTA